MKKDPFNILVVGEVIQDSMVFGKCGRKNPEAPSLVFNPEYEEISAGCAGNVVQNLKNLDPSVNIVTYNNYSIIKKQRFIDKESGYILFRVDSDDKLPDGDVASLDVLDNCLRRNGLTFNDLDILILSDYEKGFISKQFIEGVSLKALGLNIPVWLDSKKQLAEFSKNCNVKINRTEYLEQLKHNLNPEIFAKNLLVTQGPDGIWWVDNDSIFPADKVPAVSTVGSGDLVISILALAQLKGYTMESSIKLANKGAGIKVSRKGIASVMGNEVWDD